MFCHIQDQWTEATFIERGTGLPLGLSGLSASSLGLTGFAGSGALEGVLAFSVHALFFDPFFFPLCKVRKIMSESALQ